MRKMGIGYRFRKIGKKISELDWEKKILVLFILAVLVYGSGIAADIYPDLDSKTTFFMIFKI
ncbi:MAG: hypothetical protein LLG16_00925 [Euryarchaeota archaeon]|nr:hypothetical protein [Euryarchaeota archaeon]